ncbi:MAG: HTH-type transcriptional activator RhaR [bacterium]|nr:HTH-type transcriptional activator RhaR [bacterium]
MVVKIPSNFSKEQTQRIDMTAATSSFILHENGGRHHWQGVGALSIKSFYHGQAFYNVGNGCHAVNDDSYLVLNHGQSYSITIDAEKPIESFCIFFAAGLVEEVYRSLVTESKNLLDEPKMPRFEPVHFFERAYPHDEMLTPSLLHLRAALPRRQDDRGWLHEKLRLILHRLLQVHQQVRKEVEALPSLRPATREELYRRLHRAKDYAAAMFAQPLMLEEMAQVACLSPNHFLRTFKQAFAQTPHQFVTQLRLERAKRLLAQTERPVTEICSAVGFESLGSFSWLFARRIGLSPEAYRRRKMQKAVSSKR